MAEAETKVEGEGGTGGETVEDRARRMGWVPKEQFKGNPSRWSDAATWVERTENELPVLRGTLTRLERDNRDLRGKLDETVRTVTEIRDFYSVAEERAYNRAKRELEDRHRAAVGQADVPGAEAIRREIEELPKPPPKVEAKKPDAAPQIDPAVPAWVNAPEQAWYRDSAQMQGIAQSIHAELLQSQPELTIPANLAEVRRRVSAAYPDRFKNERREAPAAVSEPRGGAPRRTNSRTFDDLPADAKAAYERFARVIPGFKKEDYLAKYDWGTA